MIRYFLTTLICILSVSASAQNRQYVEMDAQKIKIDSKTLLAVTLKNTKGWHTYWKNPGDAGLAIKFKFFEQENLIALTDYPWPAPKRYIEQGNMWAYGYSGIKAFFFDLPINLQDKKLKIVGEWLVCKDICIPGTRTIEFPNNLENHLSQKELTTAFKKLPAKRAFPKNLELYLSATDKENELQLHYVIENADFSKLSDKKNILTPYHAFPFDYKHEKIYLDKENKQIYGTALIDWDGIYEDPIWNLPKDGVFKKPLTAKFLLNYPKDENSKIVEKSFQVFSVTGYKSLQKTYQGLESRSKSEAKVKGEKSKSLWHYILFAFLGGLILNLMPCVLPVISLKLFSLIGHSDQSNAKILKHNLFYTFGVVASFTVLATVVYILKASGDQIGWGFQLQSPTFVFVMLILIFIMALNMLGLFEFRTPGGTRLGGLAQKEGVLADFNNGVLATILSTPCSAPFLGSALPFAFTTTTLNIYLIFISVGLGLSFPFIITGFFPKLIAFLPKPGMWMDQLKKFLGLSLILTAIWLYDVLNTLVDLSFAGIYINTFIALVFFAFYFRKHISAKKRYASIFIILPIILLGMLFEIEAFQVSDNANQSPQVSRGLHWNKWTPAAMTLAKSQKKYTFVNFTAAWCLTCKINKKIVLQSDDFKDLVKDKDIQLLEGDWTKRDDDITSFLRSYNIVGVPAYFIIKPSGEVISLGETISIATVKDNL